MSTTTPVKMSAFATTKLSSGSFFTGLDSGSSGISNVKFSSAGLMSYVSSSLYVSIPGSSASPGSEGQLAVGGGYLYVYHAGAWWRSTIATGF